MLRVVLIGTALAAGSGAAWLALGASAKPDAEPAIVVQQSMALEEILVAAAAVPKGGKLGSAELKWQRWPADGVHAGFISRSAEPEGLSELEGSVARSELVAGEPIIREKLSPGGAGFMSAMLEPGRRAVAVRVSAENSAGGFVLPEDRVDVLHTTTGEAGEGHAAEMRTRTILLNVKVLAIDQQGSEGSEGSPETVVVGKTATLELTPTQAELIVGAEASGMLSLALRPVSESGEAQEISRPVQQEAPEAISVQVRRGSAREVVVFR